MNSNEELMEYLAKEMTQHERERLVVDLVLHGGIDFNKIKVEIEKG